MYSFVYDFFPDTRRVTLDSFVEQELITFLSCLLKNGQIIEQWWNIIEVNGYIRVYGIATDKDSVHHKYYNAYCREDFDKLIKKCKRKPAFKISGKVFEMGLCCACENPSHYVLSTTFINEGSPVICADCNNFVPLYRLPNMKGEKEYTLYWNWKDQYEACEILDILCDFGERFGILHRTRYKSPLTKQGLKICRALSRQIRKPVYYYLPNDWEHQRKRCPGCGRDWELREEREKGFRYDFRCAKCRLVSMKHAL